MKKIGVLLTARPGGGSFQYTQSVLEAVLGLSRDKYALVFAYLDPLWISATGGAGRAVELRTTLWSRFLNRLWHEARLPIAAWRRTAAHLDGRMRALAAEKCDLWICPDQDSYSFRANIPALGTVHDLMHRYEPSFAEVSDGGEYASREFHFRETCRWSRGVLVDSSVGRQQLADAYGVNPDKIFVLPYVALRRFYDHEPAAEGNLTAKYSLPDKYFFYPAQFYDHKNHAALIGALARMSSAHPEVRLVLVGSTERNGYARIRELIDKNRLADRVLVLGYVSEADMAGLYRRARALVMPTFFGPTNIPQLEAFALGCPVATSRIYGIPEQVGDAALLFDPTSVDEIHDCLVRLWTDDALCADLAAKGRAHSREWGPRQFRDRLRGIIDTLTS